MALKTGTSAESKAPDRVVEVSSAALEGRCYGWNVCVPPPKINRLQSIPQCDGIRRRAFGQ